MDQLIELLESGKLKTIPMDSIKSEWDKQKRKICSLESRLAVAKQELDGMAIRCRTAEEGLDRWKFRAEEAKEKLLNSLPNVSPALQSTPFLHEHRPSRLQIAAMVLQGMWANPDLDLPCTPQIAFAQADELIAAEKEVAK